MRIGPPRMSAYLQQSTKWTDPQPAWRHFHQLSSSFPLLAGTQIELDGKKCLLEIYLYHLLELL